MSGTSKPGEGILPPAVLAHEALNPIPQVVMAFPAPNLISGALISLAPSSQEDATCAADGIEDPFTGESGKQLAERMKQSSQLLVSSGLYPRFLADQLHRESLSGAAGVGDAGAGPMRSLVADVSTALREQLLESNSRDNGGSGAVHLRSAPSLAAAPERKKWVSPSRGMVLRPRRLTGHESCSPQPVRRLSSAEPQDAAAADETSSSSLRAGATDAISTNASSDTDARGRTKTTPAAKRPRTKKEAGGGPGDSGVAEECSTRGSVAERADTYCRRSTTEMLNQLCSLDAPSLLGVTVMLPHETKPFAAVSPTAITRLLRLVATAGGGEEKDGTAASVAAWQREESYHESLRGVAACALLSHPSFDVAGLVFDGLVQSLISLFFTCARCVSQALTFLALDEDAEAAEEDQEGNAPLGRKRRTRERHSTQRDHVVGWVEALRHYLTLFTRLACNRATDIVGEGDLVRLEDVCFQTLFLAPHRLNRDALSLFASYTTEPALRLYQAVWDRLGTQRTLFVERFFLRMLPSETLESRLCSRDGKRLLPLTLAILSAAQSTPLPSSTEPVSAAVAHRLQGQCSAWAASLCTHFLLRHRKAEKAEQQLTLRVAVAVAEDLAQLVGTVEWPVADMLLRVLIATVSKLCLDTRGDEGGGGPLTAVSPEDCAYLRTFLVEGVAHAALVLFARAPWADALDGAALQGSPDDSGAASRASASDSDAFTEAWARLVPSSAACTAPTEAEKESARPRKRRKNEPTADSHDNGDGTGLSVAADAEAETARRSRVRHLAWQVYHGLSSRLELSIRSSQSEEAAVWFNARTATVLSWYLSTTSFPCSAQLIPEASLDGLVRMSLVPHVASRAAGDAADDDSVEASLALASHLPGCIMREDLRQQLVVLLLSTLRLKDTKGAELAIPDLLVRKVVQYLSQLAGLCPSLQRVIWPIARQCVHDDSARVRESAISLLMTLLETLPRRAEEVDDAGDACLTSAQERVLSDVTSTLLFLLEDPSILVVTRAITTLDTLLTDSHFAHLYAGALGKTLVPFAHHKMLQLLVSPEVEKRHFTDIVAHFSRWWFTSADISSRASADYSCDAPCGRRGGLLAEELATLCKLGSPQGFPYEVDASHPLVVLLTELAPSSYAGGATAQAAPRGRGTAFASAAAANSQHKKKGAVDAEVLTHALQRAAGTLWSRYEAARSAEEAAYCLAGVHVLAMVNGRWVEPLLDTLLRTAEYPPASGSRLAASAEVTSVTFLHVCAILRSVFASPAVPCLSMERATRSLTVILSKYVGAFQQRVLEVTCGALVATITCGAPNRLSAHVNQPQLLHCYSLMNLYYAHARRLVPEARAGRPNAAAYLQRYLFLLSELLRLYRGWRHPNAAVLLADKATGQVPNLLAAGDGICCNVFALGEALMTGGDGGESGGAAATATPSPAGEASASRVIGLRLLSALCILEPETYLYRCELFIADALSDLADTAYCLQGLTLLRDCLADEDARVELATRQALHRQRQQQQQPLSASAPASLGGSRRRRRAGDADADEGEEEDQNSGMCTWLMQRFEEAVMRLALGGYRPAAELCLDIIQWCARDGLLPPVRYADTLVALVAQPPAAPGEGAPAATRHADVGLRAAACLSSLADKHADVIASLAVRGVVKAFRMLSAARVDLLQAVRPSGGGGSGRPSPVFGPVFALLSKRQREANVTSLARCLYNDSKLASWRAEQPGMTHTDGKVPCEGLGAAARANDCTFMAYVAAVLLLVPYHTEAEAAHAQRQCAAGVDLNGQEALDYVQGAIATVAGDSAGAASLDRPAVSRCVGVVLLHMVGAALRTEFRTTPNGRQRRPAPAGGGGGGGQHALSSRDYGRASTIQFFQEAARVVSECAPLYSGERSAATPNAVLGALRFLHARLESLLHEGGTLFLGGDDSSELRGPRPAGRRSTAKRAHGRPAARAPGKRARGRPRAGSASSSSVASTAVSLSEDDSSDDSRSSDDSSTSDDESTTDSSSTAS